MGQKSISRLIPIEGTRMVAMGQSNALAVMAFAPRDSLLHAPDMYMKKSWLLIGWRRARLICLCL